MILYKKCKILFKITNKAQREKMPRFGNEKKLDFYETIKKKAVEVLIEGKMDKAADLLKRITSNYIPDHVAGNDDLFSPMVQVKIERIEKSLPSAYFRVCWKKHMSENGSKLC